VQNTTWVRIAGNIRDSAMAGKMHDRMPGSNATIHQETMGSVGKTGQGKAEGRTGRIRQSMDDRNMSYDKAFDLVRKHEGYRDRIYKDSLGVLTCGYGHALLENSYVPAYIAERFFYLDCKSVIDDYNMFNFSLDPVRRAVILNMIFNLGRNRFANFSKMIAAVRAGKYGIAKKEMLDSRWAKQVGKRAIELSEMMELGEWPE